MTDRRSSQRFASLLLAAAFPITADTQKQEPQCSWDQPIRLIFTPTVKLITHDLAGCRESCKYSWLNAFDKRYLMVQCQSAGRVCVHPGAVWRVNASDQCRCASTVVFMSLYNGSLGTFQCGPTKSIEEISKRLKDHSASIFWTHSSEQIIKPCSSIKLTNTRPGPLTMCGWEQL